MKKTAVLTAIVCLTMLTASAQLANSKWKGIVRIPSDSIGTLKPYMVTWTFTRDTATMLYENIEMPPEVMTYTTKGNKIMFKKVSGDVPCNNTDLLTCTYSVENDQLTFKMVSDACKARSQADASQPFDRVK